MGMVCAVVFQRQGRLYYADPGELAISVGDHVLYPTDRGPEVAEVMWAPQWVSEDIGGLVVLTGLAGPDDLDNATVSRKRRAAARVAAKRLIREHALPMKLSGVDYDVADRVTTIYFSAPHRVDFRALVRDLAATMNGKVELCCSTFLVDFEPVSIRMAKDQDLPLNPLRISGACGKLMCCLKYEHPLYQDFAEKAPALGEQVETPDGEGTVVGHSVPGEKVVVRMAADGSRSACALASVCSSRKAYDGRADTVR